MSMPKGLAVIPQSGKPQVLVIELCNMPLR